MCDWYLSVPNSFSSWFQTFAVFCMLYSFFWVIPRLLNFICGRFGTLCQFHLHRLCKPTPPMKMDLTECSETLEHKIHTPGKHPKERIHFLFCLLLRNIIKIYKKPSFNILVCVRVKFCLPFRGRSTDGEWLRITGSWRARRKRVETIASSTMRISM